MISENSCGFCVLLENASAFADALEKAANGRPALTLKGANAKRLAVENFDRKTQSSTWVDVVELSFKNRGKIKL